MRKDKNQGVESNVRKLNRKFVTIFLTILVALAAAACPDPKTPGDPAATDETAATVNGNPIMLQEVERAIKATAQGQETKLSPMELAQARLQVLQQLIQQEVMYQKAQKEETIPSDDDVNAELNKRKTGSGLSKEEFEKRLKDSGQTEATLRESLKKEIATTRLVEKITGKIEPPSDAEISGFYNGNREFFVKKRGVELAAIVVDPRDNGQGDTTTNEAEASQRIKEIGQQLESVDFATVARDKSEDPSAIRGGDLGNVSEDELKQAFSPQLASGFMSEQFKIGQVAGPFPIQGKYYIFKLKNRIEKDEDLTLESPGIKQQITDTLVNNRKQLLAASYQAIAMNEAKIINFLAQKVVDNPNELSGARPVTPETKDGDSAAGDNSNSSSESNSNANANSEAKSNAEESKDAANSESGNTAEKEANTESNGGK
ncbi:MAG: SurA N-terminal domain-containing protein [Acidobacteriota bacterium]|nr:SurA N-terminal domain-containing protein [Acidobacteriota bacterium]